MLNNYKILLWDFDGVIMDSNPVRTYGFEEVLKGYPQQQLDEFMVFHKQNGGLPRYDKFRYFFEKIRDEQVSDAEIARLSARFSEIMLNKLMTGVAAMKRLCLWVLSLLMQQRAMDILRTCVAIPVQYKSGLLDEPSAMREKTT